MRRYHSLYIQHTSIYEYTYRSIHIYFSASFLPVLWPFFSFLLLLRSLVSPVLSTRTDFSELLPSDRSRSPSSFLPFRFLGYRTVCLCLVVHELCVRQCATRRLLSLRVCCIRVIELPRLVWFSFFCAVHVQYGRSDLTTELCMFLLLLFCGRLRLSTSEF